MDPPIARNRSSLIGWSTAKGKKTLAIQKKLDEQICGHCLPMHVGSARSDDRSSSIPGTLAPSESLITLSKYRC
jgi:hypothetical protein